MANLVRPLLARDSALIMGILNVTPDSFSDGGEFHSLDLAIRHAEQMVADGADIIDVGGESTRPGADPVERQEELDRVIPVIECLSTRFDVPISIDTQKPNVMHEAVKGGAQMINDVNGLRAEGAVAIAAKCDVPVCLMHMLDIPKRMQEKPDYNEVTTEVSSFLRSRIDACLASGIDNADILIDPGIGFGKTLNHNLELLNHVGQMIEDLGCEMLIGVSRKSLIGMQLGREVDSRLPASLGLAVQAVIKGAKIVRVHDVLETHDAIRMIEAVRNYDKPNNKNKDKSF